MRYLVVSDIHANWEALEVVVEAAQGRYEEILCCGDLVGYGADPNPVVDWARQNLRIVVRGNHDKAAAGLDDLEWFNPVARSAAVWTQRELTPPNAEFIRGLSKGPLSIEGFQVVHGSPVDEDEYLVSTSEAGEALHYVESRLSFFGHTHVQGGFSLSESGLVVLPRPGDDGKTLLRLRPETVYLINPGSVGQPRDGDPRSAFALFDSEELTVAYYRVAYDFAKAQAKIRRAGLPSVLADRLAMGR